MAMEQSVVHQEMQLRWNLASASLLPELGWIAPALIGSLAFVGLLYAGLIFRFKVMPCKIVVPDDEDKLLKSSKEILAESARGENEFPESAALISENDLDATADHSSHFGGNSEKDTAQIVKNMNDIAAAIADGAQVYYLLYGNSNSQKSWATASTDAPVQIRS